MTQKTTDIERAADQLRESAARLEREADLLDTIEGERVRSTPALGICVNFPPSAALSRMLVQAEQVDAITCLMEGGDPLKAAIAEVMKRGWRPEPLGPEWDPARSPRAAWVG